MIGNRTMFDHEHYTFPANDATLTLSFNGNANVITLSGNKTGTQIFLPPGDTKNAYGEVYLVNRSGQSTKIMEDQAATGNVVNTLSGGDVTLADNKTAFCKYVPYLYNYGKRISGDTNGFKRGVWIVTVG